MIVAGYDPALRESAISVVKGDASGKRLKLLHSEHISVPNRIPRRGDDGKVLRRKGRAVYDTPSINDRLRQIFDPVNAVCIKFKPDIIVIESIFQGAKLAQSRGLICGLAWSLGIEVREYTPQQIKRIVSSDRLASKPAIADVVRDVLSLPSSLELSEDQTDSIAMALTYWLDT